MKINLVKTYLVFLMLAICNNSYSQGVGGFLSNQIQSQISREISAEISKNLNENLLIPQLQVRDNAGEILDFNSSTDDRYLTILHQDGTVRIWDTGQGVQRPIINPVGMRFSKVISTTNGGVAFIGADNGNVYMYDILTGKLKSELNTGIGKEITALSVSKSETKLAVAYVDGQIVIWDLKSPSKLAELKPVSGNIINRISFIFLEKQLLITSRDGNVETWDFSKSKSVTKLDMQSLNNLGAWENPANELV